MLGDARVPCCAHRDELVIAAVRGDPGLFYGEERVRRVAPDDIFRNLGPLRAYTSCQFAQFFETGLIAFLDTILVSARVAIDHPLALLAVLGFRHDRPSRRPVGGG